MVEPNLSAVAFGSRGLLVTSNVQSNGQSYKPSLPNLSLPASGEWRKGVKLLRQPEARQAVEKPSPNIGGENRDFPPKLLFKYFSFVVSTKFHFDETISFKSLRGFESFRKILRIFTCCLTRARDLWRWPCFVVRLSRYESFPCKY